MMRSIRHVMTAAAGLMLAACNADPTAPRAGVTDAMLINDIASDAAVAVGLDLDQLLGAELAAGMPVSGPMLPSSPLCPFSALAGRFVCPTITTADGLTLDRSYGIYAGSTPQPGYDPVTTDSMRFESVLTGTLRRDARTSWLRHTRTMTVSGLAGAETQRVWNGIGARSDSAYVSGDGPPRKARLESVDKVSNLVFKLPHATNPWPQSGTITQDIVASAGVVGAPANQMRSMARHVVVTFDGTQTARVLVGATPCTLDLATRATSCAK